VLARSRFSSFSLPHAKQKCPGYEPKLEKILRHSKCCKARLLHYFPVEEDDHHSAAAAADDDDDDDDRANNNNGGARDDAQFSDWCGWHNDHGSLTGLLPALYLDCDGNVVDSPDVEAGLYIKSRDGTLVHAKIPENAVAYQVGETAQVHTGGLLKATPHGEYIYIYRFSFVAFTHPDGKPLPHVYYSSPFTSTKYLIKLCEDARDRDA
jgi:isopenicillin N synthase-like dioxygenase